MRRDYQLLAGASAVAATVALATQLVPGTDRDTPPMVTVEAPQPAPPPAPLPLPERSPELAAEITRLTAALSDREAEYARLQTDLHRRDNELDRVTAALAARNAEIRALRQQLAALRTQAAFDAELVALKSAARPVSAALPARAQPAEAPAPDAVLAEIQFESASAALTPGAHMRALAAAAALGAMQLDGIRVVGHADTVGRPEANRALSAARAAAVAELLVESGLARELIDSSGAGEAALPVTTGDGVPEPLNRSVSIIAIPTRLADAG